MSASNVAITLDVDWAPDHVIDRVAQQLTAASVRATWFVTHASPAIDRLRAHPELFELGIHPNFLVGSTHGYSPADVLAHCMALVPDARSMRTHSLVQSSPLLALVARETSIMYDVSIYLPGHSGITPVMQPLPTRPLMRLPFWWEDDYEMYEPSPNWSLARRIADIESGLCILNFHPIHIALNSAMLEPYESVKRMAPKLPCATPEHIASHRQQHGAGAGTAFDDVVALLSSIDGGRTITQLAQAA